MNFLLYIGGGWLFLIFMLDKVLGLKVEFKKTNDDWQLYFSAFMLGASTTAVIMTWAWLCWKFIA